ncbi:LysM peptidoglycan-binding domain-containing protein [Leucobacter sp. NPDC058333]|uniref:LysM peptidoglycan-binding domain-containing protein n=1 Tax=Leucobacter sp. NPDC058333 TaxID=3346450 RepID=UPI00365B84BE
MSASAVLSQDSREITVSTGSIRLTRRGRIVFGAFATVLVAALLALVAAFAAPEAMASAHGSNGQQFEYVVVQPGSSLWSLATDLDPAADPRDLVTEIVQLNQLNDSSVQAGDAIAVPLRYSDNPIVVSGDDLGV